MLIVDQLAFHNYICTYIPVSLVNSVRQNGLGQVLSRGFEHETHNVKILKSDFPFDCFDQFLIFIA